MFTCELSERFHRAKRILTYVSCVRSMSRWKCERLITSACWLNSRSKFPPVYGNKRSPDTGEPTSIGQESLPIADRSAMNL